MLPYPPQLLEEINQLHRDAVARWHDGELDNPYDGLLGVVCEQHQYNFLLWHEEDIARCPDVPDAKIADVKRSIDRYNQQRNDAIERIDQTLIEMLAAGGLVPRAGALQNTETPGSAVDRLSIMSLRIYHLDEQVVRDDIDQMQRLKVGARLDRCFEQHSDLSQSLAELLRDIFAGRRVLKVYRQLKMYNDPTLNPYLYRSRRLVG